MNYKNLAEMMLRSPRKKTYTQNEFKTIASKYNFEFIQGIEGVLDCELWGNEDYTIIVYHKNNIYSVL
jgi:hypothetical protein